MECNCLPGMASDMPLFGERNLYSPFTSFEYIHHLLQNSCPPTWRFNSDLALLQSNEDLRGSNTATLTMDPAGDIGADTVGPTSYQHQNGVSHYSHFNTPTDTFAVSGDGNSFDSAIAFSDQHQSVQMGSLSSSEYFDDTLPELPSNSATRLQWMHSSSSDCQHELDSPGSSERDRQSSTSCLAGSSSEEGNWRGSDVSPCNYDSFLSGIPLGEIRMDDTAATVNVRDLSSLVAMSRPAMDFEPFGPCFSASPEVEDLNSSMITNAADQRTMALDTLPESANTLSHNLPPYKRQRTCHRIDNATGMPLDPPPYYHRTHKGNPKLQIDSPMPSWSNTDTQYKYLRDSPRKRPNHLSKTAANVNVISSKRDFVSIQHTGQQRQSGATSIVPQSVAARHRRKKISERVRILEKLIPGGSKMDTASMLDECIDYVKFLQLQVHLFESIDFAESFTSAPSIYKGEPNRRGNFSADVSHLDALQHTRQAPTALILSEVLQNQLFKHKLCLVCISQWPPANGSLLHGRAVSLR